MKILIVEDESQQGRTMPVLFLNARDQVKDRVKGLELGADDYLVKLFFIRRAAGACPPSYGAAAPGWKSLPAK